MVGVLPIMYASIAGTWALCCVLFVIIGLVRAHQIPRVAPQLVAAGLVGLDEPSHTRAKR